MVVTCKFFTKCGGCDILDLSEKAYQNTKKAALHSVLSGLEYGDMAYHFVGPASRRRVNLHITSQNQLGFFAKKSRTIVAIDRCEVACEEISAFVAPLASFIKKQEYGLFLGVSVSLFDNGLDVVLNVKKELDFLQMQKWTSFAKDHDVNVSYRIKHEVSPVYLARCNQVVQGDVKLDLDSKVFLQATKAGLEHIVQVIRQSLTRNRDIKKIADIYAGYGAYSFAVCDLVNVHAFEGSEDMVRLINKNAASHALSHKITASHRDLFQDAIDKRQLRDFDAVVINPPRNGATPQIKQIARSELQHVIYVSCNPKSFAFDAKILQEAGFEISDIVALDQFYGSRHMELIAVFARS